MTIKIISAESDTLSLYLSKVWQNRSLITTLAKRDLKIKYAQTVIGLGWTIVQPLTAVVVYSLFFSVLLNFKSEYPYVLFVLSGVIIWNLFNYIFSQGSTSLTNNQDLIKKLYFPKIILPFSKILVALVEFAITMVLLILLMLVFSVRINFAVIFSPLIIVCVVFLSTAIALILCAATVRNRDLHHIIPFLINFGIWFTPVFYPVSIIPEQFTKFIYLNPMVGYIELFRWAIGLQNNFDPFCFISIAFTIVIFVFSIYFFVKTEDAIADNI